MRLQIRQLAFWLFAAALATSVRAEVGIDYEAGVEGNAGGGDFAPHYIMSGRGGTLTQRYGAQAHVAAWHTMDTTCRLSWGAGVELWAGYQSSTTYARYNEQGVLTDNKQHPARAWVQQAWIEGKHRGVFLQLGMKHMASPWLDNQLSSGDLIMSGNTRPPVGARMGFINPQNIPFLKGWVQIAGEIGYYRLGDGKWIDNHYGRRNEWATSGYWFNYKNIYLSSPAHMPFQLILGGQASCQFGGTQRFYVAGVEQRSVKMEADAKAFFRALIAGSGGSGGGDHFVEGNHVGSWDIIGRYRFKNGITLRAYHQTIWEDGSGIGFQNGFDGLWGLEYKAGKPSIVSGVVVEYIDMTNHSGAIHWSPDDSKHADGTPTPISHQTTGADDYYNNYAYSGYQNRGQSIGSPLVRGPIYNLDGYQSFTDNLMRGFHVGINGFILPQLTYRVLCSYCRSWGTPVRPRAKAVNNTSAMLELVYNPKQVAGLQVKAQMALDRGDLRGDNTGARVSVTYHGNLTLGK